MKQYKYSLLLILTAVIWGLAFVAQSSGSAYMGAATFTGVRFLIGALVLLPVIYVRDRMGLSEPSSADGKLLFSGTVCGFFLAAASLLQQMGISMGTSAGKAGFLTAIYIVIVPIFARLFFAQRIRLQIWISVALSMAGLYLLCVRDGLSILKSDFLVILCAFLFALQILSIDRFVVRLDPVRLSAVEFAACGLFSSAVMLVTDLRTLGFAGWIEGFAQPAAWIPLLYAGIFSSGVAYTLQIVSQKHVEPALACLIMSMESVFAAIGGWLILKQTMGLREIIGSVTVLAAVLLSQYTPKTEAR